MSSPDNTDEYPSQVLDGLVQEVCTAQNNLREVSSHQYYRWGFGLFQALPKIKLCTIDIELELVIIRKTCYSYNKNLLKTLHRLERKV